MKKRIIVLILVVALMSQVAFAGTVSNFTEKRTYTQGMFSDVAASMWYAENIADCYSLGLIDGMPGGLYNPSGYVTLAESIKMAVVLHSLYETGKEYEPENLGGAWYASYVGYAIKYGIIKSGSYDDYNVRASRSDFAMILANALPPEAITPQNRIADGKIPDVLESYSYGKAVYTLYRAGVLSGAGADGEFYPNLPVTRAEAATILLRMADATRRIYVQRAGILTAEELYAKCAPAIIFIEVFDKEGTLIKTGSGFFIEESGLAVTNSHVIADAEYATIKLANGENREILGIYGYDMLNDCALIQIEGGGYPTLEIGRYELKTGADIYTIGNPIGLVNTYSKGIISTSRRVFNDVTYIQIDAAISAGSSGGALLDAAGRVIGITSAAVNGGQSLNLAMPISVIDALETDTLYDLGKVPTADTLYEGYFPTPSFSEYSGLSPTGRTEKNGMLSLTFDLGYVLDSDSLIDGYVKLLEKYMFAFYAKSGDKEIYYNSLFGTVVSYSVVGRGRSKTLLLEIY